MRAQVRVAAAAGLRGSLDSAIFGDGLIVVTQKTLFGGRYGFMGVLPGANNRVQGSADFDSNPGAGLTDMYVQPISLGWTKPRGDFTAAYGLYVPTGRYEDGGDNNTGLGQWAQEILVGTTVYLNERRTVHAAAPRPSTSSRKLGARTTTEGATWNVLVTLPVKPIRIP
jgi:hypothetical protein